MLRKLLVGDSTLTAPTSPVLKMFIIRIKIRAMLENNLARAQGEGQRGRAGSLKNTRIEAAAREGGRGAGRGCTVDSAAL